MSLQAIDRLKKRLDALLTQEDINNDEVLRISVELDKYIVEYMAEKIKKDINQKLKY